MEPTCLGESTGDAQAGPLLQAPALTAARGKPSPSSPKWGEKHCAPNKILALMVFSSTLCGAEKIPQPLSRLMQSALFTSPAAGRVWVESWQ